MVFKDSIIPARQVKYTNCQRILLIVSLVLHDFSLSLVAYPRSPGQTSGQYSDPRNDRHILSPNVLFLVAVTSNVMFLHCSLWVVRTVPGLHGAVLRTILLLIGGPKGFWGSWDFRCRMSMIINMKHRNPREAYSFIMYPVGSLTHF